MTPMNMRRLILAAAVMAIVAGGGFVVGEDGIQQRIRLGVTATPPSYSMVSAAVLTRAGLPSEESAKTMLSAALAGTRHPQWIDIPAGSATVRAFVVFPDREETSAPVVV